MKQFKDSTVTSVGQSLISSVNEGRDKMIYTRAVLSTQDINSLTDEQLTGLTELTDQRQSSPITIIDRNTNTINIGVDFKNNNVTSDYQFNSVGWYAKGTQDNPNEILFAVTPSVGTQTMPAGAHNAATASIRLNLYIALDYNTQVQANPTTSGAINGNDLQAGLNGLLSKGLIYTGNEIVNNDDVNNYHNTAIININGQTVDNMPDGFSGHGYLITVGSNDTQKDGCHLIYDSHSNHIYVSQFNSDSNNWSTWQRLANKKELDDVINDINEKLNQAGKLKKISVNGGVPVEPDDKGVANIDIKEPDLSGFETKEDAQRQLAKKVESVNGRLPDNLGAIRLPSFSNADFVINKSDFDLDTATNPGYYRFVSANLSTGVNNTNGLTDLPNFTNVSGYLIVINYSDYYVCQLLMLLDTADVKDITFAFRTIGKNNYKYRDKFKRLITSNELRDLQNQYAELRDREIVHSCDDLATGTAYSKAHPNVIVGTP